LLAGANSGPRTPRIKGKRTKIETVAACQLGLVVEMKNLDLMDLW
jgi:hypothetical protein